MEIGEWKLVLRIVLKLVDKLVLALVLQMLRDHCVADDEGTVDPAKTGALHTRPTSGLGSPAEGE